MFIRTLQQFFKLQTSENWAVKLASVVLTIIVLILGLLLASGILFNAAIVDFIN